jgi:hypothetical protein
LLQTSNISLWSLLFGAIFCFQLTRPPLLARTRPDRTSSGWLQSSCSCSPGLRTAPGCMPHATLPGLPLTLCLDSLHALICRGDHVSTARMHLPRRPPPMHSLRVSLHYSLDPMHVDRCFLMHVDHLFRSCCVTPSLACLLRISLLRSSLAIFHLQHGVGAFCDNERHQPRVGASRGRPCGLGSCPYIPVICTPLPPVTREAPRPRLRHRPS